MGFNEHKVSILQDEKVLERDSSDGCTIMSIYLKILNCTFKTGENGQFYVIHILPRFKKTLGRKCRQMSSISVI